MTKFEITIGDQVLVIVKPEHQHAPNVSLKQESGDSLGIDAGQAVDILLDEENRLMKHKQQIDNRLADLRILRLQITDSNGDRPSSDYSNYSKY